MSDQDTHLARAEQMFRPESARHEKGSAMTLIAEEARASQDKTARLKALRMAQEATAAPEPAKPARKSAARKTQP